MISKIYEKIRKSSPDFYINLIKEGILINDAVSHYKYATLCIIESTKNKRSDSKLDEAVNHLEESIKNGYLFSYLLLSFVYHDLYKDNVKAFNAVKEGANRGEKILQISDWLLHCSRNWNRKRSYKRRHNYHVK